MIKAGFTFRVYNPKQVGNSVLFSIADKDKNNKYHYISVIGNSSQPVPQHKQSIIIEAIEGVGLSEYKEVQQTTLFLRYSIAPERHERPTEKYVAKENFDQVINVESDDLPF
jgi:hypothetical protein